jgi:hypothetical protein
MIELVTLDCQRLIWVIRVYHAIDQCIKKTLLVGLPALFTKYLLNPEI